MFRIFSKKEYKFTDKKHSPSGIFSTVIAFAGLCLLTAAVVISYGEKGNAGSIIGIMGISVFFMSFAGTVIGLKSFKNDDVFYLYSYIGTILNIAEWLFIMGMIMIGL